MIQQGHIFIDPENCGSSVGYRTCITDYENSKKEIIYSLSATVSLTDCNHKIDWEFSTDDLDKIDTAIAILKEFRTKYVIAQRTYANLIKK